MKKIIALKSFLLITIATTYICPSIRAQEPKADSTAFYTYLDKSLIASAVKLSDLLALHQDLRAKDKPGGDKGIKRGPSSSFVLDKTLSLGYFSGNTINATGYRAEFGDWDHHTISGFFLGGLDWKASDSGNVDKLCKRIRQQISSYLHTESYKNTDKEKLIHQLTAFDSLSHNKPLFFSTIYGKFGGDIKAYVDYLYKRSFLTNRFRLNTFMRWPSAKKIERDPGVQFILGLALYELWLKRGGEAVAEEPQDSTAVPSQTDSIPAK